MTQTQEEIKTEDSAADKVSSLLDCYGALHQGDTFMEFTACKHLDFEDNYTAKKQVLGSGKVFWLRDVPSDMPAMVQFCKLRGRMNSPEACTQEKFARCSNYEEFLHNVSNESIAP